MTEHPPPIPLSALRTVRLMCAQCGAAIEFPIRFLLDPLAPPPSFQCPDCQAVHGYAYTPDNPVWLLAKAVAALEGARERFTVEFVAPEKNGAGWGNDERRADQG